MKKIIGMNLLLVLFIVSAAFANVQCDIYYSDTTYRYYSDTTYRHWHVGDELLAKFDINKSFSGSLCLTYIYSDELSSVLNYKNGKLDGESVYYRENGHVESRWNYKNDELDGKQVFYYKDGTVRSTSNYKNGKLDGEAVLYNADDAAVPARRWNYKNGTVEGIGYGYYADGTVGWICHYKNDHREGKCTWYFADGHIAGTAMYKNNTLVGVKHCTDGRIGSDDLDCTER